MPRVQAYGDRQVRRAPLPGVKQTTVSPVGEGLSQLGGQVSNIVGREIQAQRIEADRNAVLEAHNTLSSWRQERLNNPETGALTIKGKDSFGLPDTLEAEFSKFAGEVEGKLSGGRQRAAFARIRTDQLESLRAATYSHVSRERQSFYAEQAQAGVALAESDAIANADNPALISKHLGMGAAIIRDHLKGQAPETIASAVQKFQTGVHVGVIEQLLASDKDIAASEYFQETKHQIDGAAIARIERTLEEGSLRGESQRQADAIVEAGGSLSDWREKAKAIEDPKVRDEVMRRVEDEGRMKAAESRQASESMLRGAYDILDKTGSIRKIPPSLWTALDGSDRSALRSYAKSMVEGGGSAAIKTDMGALYNLLTLSSTNEDAFLKTNLLQYRNQLSNSDLEQMMRQQATMRGGGKKGDSTDLFVNEKAQNAMVDEALNQFGLDVTPGALAKIPGGQDRVNAFRRSVREAVNRHEQQTGKKAQDADVQGIVDTLATRTGQRMTKDGWFVDTYAPTFAFETAQAKVTSINDVPRGEQSKIRAALLRRGVAVSDAKIVDLFNQNLSRVRGDR